MAEEPTYHCPKCHDSHFVHPLRDGKPDYTDLVGCECVRAAREMEQKQHVMRWCELPEASEHMTFDNFRRSPELEQTYQAAVAVAVGQEGANFLTLMSDVDRGKTHLAVAICRHWLGRGKLAKYAYVPLLLDELRRGFSEGGSVYQSRFDMFLNTPLLVLDDLGVENSTPWVQEKLDTIVDYRLMHGLPLVVTTNLMLEQLSVRIASRLTRSGRLMAIGGPAYSTIREKPHGA